MTNEREEQLFPATALPRKPRRWPWQVDHDWWWRAALILPAFLVVILVQFYPLAYSVFLSFQDWRLTEAQVPQGFIGLENFAEQLSDDVFRHAVRNSAFITGGAIIVEMLLGIWLAYLTMGSSWLIRSIRTILILPMVIAPVAAGTLWRMILNYQSGLANYLLALVGIQGPEWLSSPDWAIVSVILLDIWQWTPFVLLVVAAAITSIPDEVLEAAAIDGGSRWQIFWHVEFPLLRRLLLLTLVFRMLDSLLSLDSIYSLTFGGPGFSTYTMTFYIYNQGLKNFNLGEAAAASWLFMLFAGAAIAVAFYAQRQPTD